MIRIFRKSWRRSKRTVCAALCLVLLSSLLVIPASAAYTSFSGSMEFVSNFDGVRKDILVDIPHTGGTDGYSLSSGAVSPGTHELGMRWTKVSNLGVVSGAIGYYYSFYWEFPGASSVVPAYDFSDLVPVVAYDTLTENARFYPDTYGNFTPFSVSPKDGSIMSKGYVCKARTPYIESINPISNLWLDAADPASDAQNVDVKYTYTSSSTAYPLMYCPSATVIISDVVTLEWMEGLADSLTGDSDILTALYADIMSILNDMYSVMQDQLAVERAIKGYFETLLPLVNSINTNIANIYSLLQTQFQLLRILIATESDDIQAAIEKQTDDLIAYFDTVFSGATGDMPEKSDDLQSSVGNVSDAESNYQSTATDRFAQLADAFTGFSGGTLGGVTLAATLFTRVWDTLGEYKIVYTWPLLLGLCLVILGRMSRLSGGQSSAEKRRGDSDA